MILIPAVTSACSREPLLETTVTRDRIAACMLFSMISSAHVVRCGSELAAQSPGGHRCTFASVLDAVLYTAAGPGCKRRFAARAHPPGASMARPGAELLSTRLFHVLRM